MQFDDRLCEWDFTGTAKDVHRQEYFDTMIPSSPASSRRLPVRPTSIHRYSYHRITANEELHYDEDMDIGFGIR